MNAACVATPAYAVKDNSVVIVACTILRVLCCGVGYVVAGSDCQYDTCRVAGAHTALWCGARLQVLKF